MKNPHPQPKETYRQSKTSAVISVRIPIPLKQLVDQTSGFDVRETITDALIRRLCQRKKG